MILADTSVWIDHLRSEDIDLASLLELNEIVIHPMVIGEMACGNVGNRAEIFGSLRSMPRLPAATDEEVLFFIEYHRLMGRGIGYIDAHLLASVTMAGNATLWTKDRRLMRLATELGVAYSQS